MKGATLKRPQSIKETIQGSGLRRENLSVLEAWMGLLPSVDSLMRYQVGLVAEVLPALQAVIGFLPGVDPLVLYQICLITKVLPTL